MVYICFSKYSEITCTPCWLMVINILTRGVVFNSKRPESSKTCQRNIHPPAELFSTADYGLGLLTTQTSLLDKRNFVDRSGNVPKWSSVYRSSYVPKWTCTDMVVTRYQGLYGRPNLNSV